MRRESRKLGNVNACWCEQAPTNKHQLDDVNECWLDQAPPKRGDDVGIQVIE